MAQKKKLLGEILIDSGLITEEALDKALVLQRKLGKKLGEVLVTEGFTTDDQIVEAVKRQLGIQSINLDNINISKEIINIVPEGVVRKHEVLPVDIINGQLLMAMADPLNYYALEDIKLATGYSVKTAIAPRKSVISNIEKYYGQSKAKEAAENFGKIYGFKNNISELTAEANENAAPVIKFLNTIIDNAILHGASDIHIEPDENDLRVRYRVDGVLREIMRTNIGMLDPVVSRIKLMANLNIAEKRVPQDGRVNYRAGKKNIDLRISTLPLMWGEKVVARVLDKSSFNLDLKTLGMDKEDLEKVSDIISKPYGILLVCGPTGSGKTTSLYSFLNVLNDVEKNIITVEDPVEYNFKGINQMQVNSRIGVTFASGLRTILRQDPDIIMVGEIRDGETAEISVRSALTGHLVLSTIHTNNAAGTITRLEDMGIEPFLLSSTIVGIVAQRLIRKICPNCSKEYITNDREMHFLNLKNPATIRRGEGCSLCNFTGYRGRVGVYEIMTINSEIRELIDQKRSEREIEAEAVKNGMTLLREACSKKVLAGVTTVDEMLRITYGFDN
jgi:type IV pilus assembly protein PilB